MPRRTKEELRIARTDERLDALVKANRFLRNPVYYKNQYWSMAAWDSWAAQGKAGGCGCCGVRYYNGSLRNIRKTTTKGGGKGWLNEVSPNLCYDCIGGIEKRIDFKFNRR